MAQRVQSKQWAIRGVVLETDDDVARVRVGDETEDWYFPLAMISDEARIGDRIWLQAENNRFRVIEMVPQRASGTLGFAERLERWTVEPLRETGT